MTDAVAIGHRAAPAADAYSREAAVAEARAFLAGRPYVSAQEAQAHRDDAPSLVKVSRASPSSTPAGAIR